MTEAGSSSSDTESVWSSAVDLFVCFALTLLFVLSQLPGEVGDQPVLVSFQFLFLLSVPGYAFVSALFPKRATNVRGDPYNNGTTSRSPDDDPLSSWVFDEDRRDTASTSSNESRMGLPERGVLSLGFGLPIVVLGGIVLNVSQWEISSTSVTTVVATTTIVSLGIAAFRRWRTATTEQFGIGTDYLHPTPLVEAVRADSTMETVFNVLIIAGVALTLLSFTFGLVTSHSEERSTEFYVLGQNESGGLVAGSYPTEYAYGEPQRIHLGIGNREGENEQYHVAISLQRFDTENETREKVNERSLKNISVNVTRGERRVVETQVTPQLTGTNVRLELLLYRDSLPRDPSVDTAYRNIHYWVNVSTARTTENRVQNVTPRWWYAGATVYHS